MVRRLLVFGLLLVGSAAADEGRSIPSPALQEVRVSSGDRQIRISLVVFAGQDFVLRVIDNADGNKPRFTTLAGAMDALGCVAGCNGSFFERSPFSPVGLMISGGQRVGRFDPDSWMKGLLVVRSGGATLESTEAFKDSPDIAESIQSGPWLVRSGQTEPDSSRTQIARRTFVCHDAQGIWAIGASGPCTLSELAAALKSPEVTAVIDIHSAINLDGGPSTGLWLKRPAGNFYLPEKWPVRNYLGVFPREDHKSP